MLNSRIPIIIWIIAAVLTFVLIPGGTGIVILFTSVMILVFCLLISLVTGRRLEFDMNSEKADDGKSRTLMTEWRNFSRIPVFSLSYDISVNNITTDEITIIKSTSENMFQIETDHCGCLEISLADVKVYDFLKFFRRSVDYNQSCTITIPPHIKDIAIDEEKLDAYDLESYEFSSYRKGSDPAEIFDLHEYREGDRMKSIHWKLSSKLDEIIIKEYSYPVDNRTMVVLNNSMIDSDSLTADQRNDLIELLVSVSAAMTGKNMAHTLGWYDYYHGHFVQENVESMENLWSLVPAILKSGFREDAVSAAYHYLEQRKSHHYANYIYITENDIRDLDKLGDFGAVSIYESSKIR